MENEKAKHGEGPPSPPKTIIPDKLLGRLGDVESHEEFMDRIRKLKSLTDPNADKYGRVKRSEINRLIPKRKI